MEKLIRVWGVLTLLAICLIAAIPEPEPTEIEWEPIPIIETKIIEPIRQKQKFIIHYEPIEPDYECRDFSYEEAQMLMRIAQAEAGNQGIQGMMLIMQVVLNRVADPAFPNTVKEVIEQPGQFETVSNGIYYSIELNAEVHLALSEIEKGVPYDEAIIGFETASNGKTLERYFCYAYTAGNHDFYITK
jgi:N-acetylmuramoyl-L-alanine amidase